MGKATVYHTKLYKLVSSKNVIHSEQKICRYIFGLNRYHVILQYNLVERFWCINWLISDFSKPLIIFIKKKIRNHILQDFKWEKHFVNSSVNIPFSCETAHRRQLDVMLSCMGLFLQWNVEIKNTTAKTMKKLHQVSSIFFKYY